MRRLAWLAVLAASLLLPFAVEAAEVFSGVKIPPMDPNVSVTVYQDVVDGGTASPVPATITDKDGNPLANPFYTDGNGNFEFAAGNGIYSMRLGGTLGGADPIWNGGAGFWVSGFAMVDPATLGGGGAVDSVNGQTGVVVLDADDLTDGAGKVMMTTAERAKLSGVEGGATGDQTGAEIKAAYEGEANTNAYTDAEKSKLAGVATGAEVNVQADWNQADSQADDYINNKPSVFSAGSDGLVPDPVTSSGNCLKDDGSWGACGTGGGISDAPVDGKLYLRKDGAWQQATIAARIAADLAEAPGSLYWVTGYSNSGSCVQGVDTPSTTTQASMTVYQNAVTAGGGDADLQVRWLCVEAGNVTMDSGPAYVASYAAGGDILITGGTVVMDGEPGVVASYAVGGDIILNGAVVMDSGPAYVASYAVSGDLVITGPVVMDGGAAYVESYAVGGDITVQIPTQQQTLNGTSADGFVTSESFTSWSASRNAASGTAVDTTSGTMNSRADDYDTESDYITTRSILTFDVPSGITITEATLHFTEVSNYGTTTMGVYTNSTTTLPLTTSDFDNLLGTPPPGDLVGTFSSSATGAKSLTLDATAVAYLNTKVGTTASFIILEKSHDMDNVPPATDTAYGATIATSEYGVPSSRPTLDITY